MKGLGFLLKLLEFLLPWNGCLNFEVNVTDLLVYANSRVLYLYMRIAWNLDHQLFYERGFFN